MTLLQLLRQRCQSCTDDVLAATASTFRDHGVNTTLLTQGGLSMNDMDRMHIHLNVGRAIVNAFGAPGQYSGDFLSNFWVVLHIEARTTLRCVLSTAAAVQVLAMWASADLGTIQAPAWVLRTRTMTYVGDPLLKDRESSIGIGWL